MGSTEIDLINTSAVSSTPWVGMQKLLPLLYFSGLRTLDVGGAGSDATACLLAQGNDSYALDPKFAVPDAMKEQIEISNGRMNISDNERRLRQEALITWSNSIKLNPERYIPGSATSIPFPDDFFDLVFSINALTLYFDSDRQLLLSAASECLRVTRPGGSILFSPFEFVRVQKKRISRARLSNNRHLAKWFQEQTKVATVRVIDRPIRRLLIDLAA